MRGYLLLPGHGDCKTCLGLRVAFLNERFAPDAKNEADAEEPEKRSE
jgi:hypothetical protein